MKNSNQSWQQKLAYSDNRFVFAFLAVLVGLGSALVITFFRLLISWSLTDALGMPSAEDFESMSYTARLALLAIGAAVLITLFYLLKPGQRTIGIGHVIRRVEWHQGLLPLSNMLWQFAAVCIALISGQSGGREGPAVHMGAGIASQLGQLFGVPHHRLRVLAGCGVASAISASFNTPMAGVIFAMEVILSEYEIRSFIPVILSAVCGAIVTQAVFGSDPAFDVPHLVFGSLLELPFVLVLAIICGLLAAFFMYGVKRAHLLSQQPTWLSWSILVALTMLISIPLPSIMGIGYDSIDLALAGEPLLWLFVALLAGKMLLSMGIVVVGFPVGIIGPVLFIGAMTGAVLGTSLQILQIDVTTSTGFYAMLGMGAMMSAILNAPLAALIALLELTNNPNIIMPGMLCIVIANLIAFEGFKQTPILNHAPQGNIHSYSQILIHRMLRNTWVNRLGFSGFSTSERHISLEKAHTLFKSEKPWVFIAADNTIVRLANIIAFIESNTGEISTLDLQEIPAERFTVKPIVLTASLEDALAQMQTENVQWLAVYTDKRLTNMVGLLSRKRIEEYYQYKPL